MTPVPNHRREGGEGTDLLKPINRRNFMIYGTTIVLGIIPFQRAQLNAVLANDTKVADPINPNDDMANWLHANKHQNGYR